MTKLGPRELVKDVQQEGLCIGCGSCVDLCPYFRSHRGRTVMLHACDLPQGRCHAWCPKTELDLEALSQGLWGEPHASEGVGHHISLAASQAGPGLGQGHFQGGGTVSALLATALEEGLVQGAILTGGGGLEPAPRLARSREEVLACAGSKFTASPTLAALNQAQKAGHGELAVVATPCQGASLAKRRLDPWPERGPVGPAQLVVGLFCNWALDRRGLSDFLTSWVRPQEIVGMEIPPPPAGVLLIQTAQGRVEIPLDQIRHLIPPACAICPDLTSQWADVSVGMFEGRPGWNTLIVRSPLGQDLVQRAVAKQLLILEDLPSASAEHLAQAATNKRQRALSEAARQELLGAPGQPGSAALRVASPQTAGQGEA